MPPLVPHPARFMQGVLAALLLLATTFVAAQGMPQLAAGKGHSLALHADGEVWAWGLNNYGQLGRGDLINQPLPVQLTDLPPIVALAAGSDHSAAVDTGGVVWSWGRNHQGQLGSGTTIDRSRPAQVGGITTAVAVASGGNHTLALLDNGRVVGWGNNEHGQLGDGSTLQRTTPVSVANLSNVVAIAAGEFHSLALRSDGSVWAWGVNSSHQLGDGGTVARPLPAQVTGLQGVVGIAAGDVHSLAVRGDGSVWSWGHSRFGQLGNVAVGELASTPQEVPGLSAIRQLFAGAGHSLALAEDGSLWAWGQNLAGQLGDGGQINQAAPQRLRAVQQIVLAAAGSSHTLALASNGAIWSWGSNEAGQLGVSTLNISTPIEVNALSEVERVVAGADFSLAIARDGSLWSWGSNSRGQLGDGTTTPRNLPARIADIPQMIDLAAGQHHVIALTAEGTLWVWGGNDKGQLGDGTTTDRPTPTAIAGLSNVVAINAGVGHSSALLLDGTVWTWGNNEFGQIGDGTIGNRDKPTHIAALSGVITLTSGGGHSLALTESHHLWTWGQNHFGQLGDGSGDNSMSPLLISHDIQGMPLIIYVAPEEDPNAEDTAPEEGEEPIEEEPRAPALIAALTHSLLLNSEGKVWSWGYNHVGQLGHGNLASRSRPQQIAALGEIDQLAASVSHNLALSATGELFGWGENLFGQLGDGSRESRLLPVLAQLPPELGEILQIAAGGGHSLAVAGDGTLWSWGRNEFGELGNGRIALIEGLTLIGDGSLTIKNITFEDGQVVTYSSDTRIQSEGDVVLLPGSTVHLVAPQILLAPGFRVSAGATLYAGNQPPTQRATRRALHSAREGEYREGEPEPTAKGSAPLPAAAPVHPVAPPRAHTLASAPPALQRRLAAAGAEVERLFSDAQGRYWVFATTAPLTLLDHNGVSDIYLYDHAHDAIRLISARPDGSAPASPSYAPRIDGVGSALVFISGAALLPSSAEEGRESWESWESWEGRESWEGWESWEGAEAMLYHYRIASSTLTRGDHGPAAHPILSAAGEQVLYQRQEPTGHHRIYTLYPEWPVLPPQPIPQPSGAADDHRAPLFQRDPERISYLAYQRNEEGIALRCTILQRNQLTSETTTRPCPPPLLHADEPIGILYPDGSAHWFTEEELP